MPKTYSVQIEKAQDLVVGLKKNQETVRSYGITPENITLLEQDAAIAFKLNDELDTLRHEVNSKAAETNRKLTEMRERLQAMKHIIKQNFDQTRWESFGIMDKR